MTYIELLFTLGYGVRSADGVFRGMPIPREIDAAISSLSPSAQRRAARGVISVAVWSDAMRTIGAVS